MGYNKQGVKYHLNKRGKRSRKLPPFVPMTWEMLNSKAYKELSYSASKALPYFIGKPKKRIIDPEHYQIDFAFTYREAKKCGFTTATWKKCIIELIEKGFIDPVWKGGLRGDGKSSNKFRMSLRWLDYGTAEFKIKSWGQFVRP